MPTRRELFKYAGMTAAMTWGGASLLARPDDGSDEQKNEDELFYDPRRIREQADDLTRNFMLDQSISAGQLAIRQSGCLLLNHSYQYGNVIPSVITNRTLFRLASCSKIFTCAAIDALSQEGKLDLNTKVFPLLGITSAALPSQTPSPYINRITVSQLVNHAGGWNDGNTVKAKDGTIIPGSHFDPVFKIREITKLLNLSGPATKRDLALYMYGEPLQFIPGTQNFDTTGGASYSNFGYLLLGLVIEEITGEPYIDYVRWRFADGRKPLDVHLARMLAGPIHNREAWYEDPSSGPNALEPHSGVYAPYPYGGEGYVTELMDSGGGLMTNAATLSGFINQHAVWGLGGRAAGSARSGSMAGTSSYAGSLTNNVDFAYIFNTRSFSNGNALNDYTGNLTALLRKI
jgi:CubicO group peptidase (beta-lactamase class C family)